MKRILFFGIILLKSWSFAADSYQVPISTHLRITEFAICKSVFNGSPTGRDLFVPTRTLAEWNAFLSNLPSGVYASV